MRLCVLQCLREGSEFVNVMFYEKIVRVFVMMSFGDVFYVFGELSGAFLYARSEGYEFIKAGGVCLYITKERYHFMLVVSIVFFDLKGVISADFINTTLLTNAWANSPLNMI
jgi:hypothetical protein